MIKVTDPYMMLKKVSHLLKQTLQLYLAQACAIPRIVCLRSVCFHNSYILPEAIGFVYLECLFCMANEPSLNESAPESELCAAVRLFHLILSAFFSII